MDIVKTGIAGTLESSDLMVTIKESGEDGIHLELKSTVQQQFGEEIKEVALAVLRQYGVKRCKVSIEDKGALDCTVIARVRTAVSRACGNVKYNWEVGR
ncbi:citrate lyase acyl carrier protein [Anaerotalea alkaliphila]|uniref:Citrate lyase acyl carrier protein n=1 Tax=Anaerotalea alkaliphila TaxID=2662126 RepID=A0A7X5HUJ6_9FIRM|nr:citrate lyase acyl carrier protein [Anaerotalea alkaliphila]NDL66835.1 citrate lyase acyl carrier protein [Anaerotalea alkaliphila]